MILNGNCRGGARNLALHLLKEENEHVAVYQVRGFASDTLPEALNEAYAVSRGTRCKKFLFSLSLNPPPGHDVSTEAFEAAVDRAEAELGLTGQPRAIVFHEKQGRRHAHAVWSRIDADAMKAIPLPYSHMRLRGVSRELFIEHGFRMPRGLADSRERDPRNFSLEEYQQARRHGKDPRAIKTAIQDAWALSDSKAAFIHALEERGFKLARGDRRGFVALDHTGEPYAVAKWAGVKTKALRERLGDAEHLPAIAEVRQTIARDMLPAMQRLGQEQDRQRERLEGEFGRRRALLVERQRDERAAQDARLHARQMAEARERQARFAPGVRGLWDRLSGEHRRTKEKNELEAYDALLRDRTEKDDLIFGHLAQRAELGRWRTHQLARHDESRRLIDADTRTYAAMAKDPREELREEFKRTRLAQAQQPARKRDGPEPGR